MAEHFYRQETVDGLNDRIRALEAELEAANARVTSEGSDAAAARKRVRELVAQVAGLEQSNTFLGDAAQRADAERDEWRASDNQARDALNELFGKLGAAEAERDALKARVAEVLEPFAAFSDHAVDSDGWCGPPGRIVDWFGPSIFRRVAELHAILSGEQS